MEIYLVGGAVRDELLGRKVKDKDWVVVGSSPNEMLALGFSQVGKSFPVFLHPKTKEEYALARVERKIGPGYGGFEFDTKPDVTLEEDLRRRDLTINAFAQNDAGTIVDVCGGKEDLKLRVLKHISPAFTEDPLRVLRVARFYAQLSDYNFTIASETMSLLQEISQTNELSFLSKERIWNELERSFASKRPDLFIECLYESNSLKTLFPAIDKEMELQSEHILRLLKYAGAKVLGFKSNFALLCSCIKARPQLEELFSSNCVPREIKDFSVLLHNIKDKVFGLIKLSPDEILTIYNSVDVYRKKDRFLELLPALTAYAEISGKDSSGVHQFESLGIELSELKVDLSQYQGKDGKLIAKYIEQHRLAVIADFLKN